MASLPDSLRRTLEKTVVEAREVAEAGARAALQRLGVHRPEPFAEMSPEERQLRVVLRAHARQLGDIRKESGEQEIAHLVAECAYEHWHRMLFARFLAENHILIHPEQGVPVSLAECEELAAEEPEDDGWVLAGRFAARMLPAIFRPDDPILRVRFAPEHQHTLQKLLAELPAEVFTADDSLGWVYQFWQTKRKKEVNESGNKIGADEIAAVTQLFTEPYMVQFLLHNTLGAWWAGKLLAGRPELAQTAKSEEDLRKACALPDYEWAYMRFVREKNGIWRPAAGTFDGWPERAVEITVLDPCCGSGHFLVEAFRILVAMRMAEESLSAREACDTVLRDNLFGLEIDERCTQIAAFNLALAAWTYPNVGGYRPLPELNIACSGFSVGAKEEEWIKVAGRDERVREGMRRLYRLFQDAPTLGSLIDPKREFEAKPGELEFDRGRFTELRPLLEQALARDEVKRDATVTEAGITAQGMAKAAALLAGSYTLVATNVPYLARGKQDRRLRDHADRNFPAAKNDLATCFVERALAYLAQGGTSALVSPHSWLFLPRYERLRKAVLENETWQLVSRLGPGAFEMISGEVVNVALVMITRAAHSSDHIVRGTDVSKSESAHSKSSDLLIVRIDSQTQTSILNGLDSRVLFLGDISGALLRDFAISRTGTRTADNPRFLRAHWELCPIPKSWRFLQSTVRETVEFGGRQNIILWQDGCGDLAKYDKLGVASIQGEDVWGNRGVAVSLMGELPCTLYLGEIYDMNCGVICPTDAEHLKAVWAFCVSSEFNEAVRKIDPQLKLTTATLLKVPFDLARWTEEGERRYPNNLPEPDSDDPTQWIFRGIVPASSAPLQIGVARLLGYRWPDQTEEDLDDLIDDDGIVCIPPVRGEQPAAARLQQVLVRAYGDAWTPATLPSLLEEVNYKGKTLEKWIRDAFFEQQCLLFHQRPFIWHIWDGRRDGFAALVNYHRLDRKLLERLAYTYLGDWIEQQRRGVGAGERGAEDRAAAALDLKKRLELILEGEPPHDIFVRWKPIGEQPIGWTPDLNDGVRLNIRPFVGAGVLRKNPRITWIKDRGSEPSQDQTHYPWFWKGRKFSGERVNDIHLTNAEKQAARQKVRSAI